MPCGRVASKASSRSRPLPAITGAGPLDGLKVKAVQRQEFVIIGWRPPDYGDTDVRGLFLATSEDGLV